MKYIGNLELCEYFWPLSGAWQQFNEPTYLLNSSMFLSLQIQDFKSTFGLVYY